MSSRCVALCLIGADVKARRISSRRGRGNVLGKRAVTARLATEWHVDVQDSQGLNVSMEDRVRRKLNAMGFVNLKGKERATGVMFKRSAGWTGSVSWIKPWRRKEAVICS